MKALLTAFAKAQGEFNPLIKDGMNPAFKSKYATLEAVQGAAFPALAKNGLVVLQSARVDWGEDGKPMVIVGVALWHTASEEMVAQEIALPPVQSTSQGIGSAITYGRRYALMTLLGLAPDDDDGNSASNTPVQGRPVNQPKPQQAAAKAEPAQTPDAQNSNEEKVKVAPSLIPDRPQWANVPAAKAWAAQHEGLFAAPQHLDAAFKLCMAAAFPGSTVIPAGLLEVALDAWYTDVVRRIGKSVV